MALARRRILIEVAETSQRYDRQVKLPLYAQAAVPEVWILDLPGETIEVYRQPTADGYEHVDSLSVWMS